MMDFRENYMQEINPNAQEQNFSHKFCKEPFLLNLKINYHKKSTHKS